MTDNKYAPAPHDHDNFLASASKRKGFKAAYDALGTEYELPRKLTAARIWADPTQKSVAELMGEVTTKSAGTRPVADGEKVPSKKPCDDSQSPLDAV